MPVYAERVVFLVDRTRSMLSWVDGVTRLQELQKELEGVIRALNEHTFFNVLVYNTVVRRWESELVLATPVAKADAIRFAYDLTAEGKTAIYEALDTALDQDPSLEAIIFLTDGKPTAGKITDHDEIVRVITLKNAFGSVSINPIGIDTRGNEARFLENLARLNSGTFRIIR